MARHHSSVQAVRSSSNNLKQKKIFSILLTLVVILIAAIIFTSIMKTNTKHKLTNMAEQQLQLVQQKDFTAAYQMTSDHFREGVSLEDFKTFLTSIVDNTIQFTTNTLEGNFGYVAGTVQTVDSKKMNIEWQFIRENKQWKIQAVRLSPIQATESKNETTSSSANPPPQSTK